MSRICGLLIKGGVLWRVSLYCRAFLLAGIAGLSATTVLAATVAEEDRNGGTSAASQAGAQQVPAPAVMTASEFCGAKTTMTPAERIRQLVPAKSPEQLLQLLRQLHDHFLLLDPSFIEDDNLMRLFGPGEVKREWPYGKNDEMIWKVMSPSAESPLGVQLKVDGRRANYVGGRIYIGTIMPTLPYTAELIEQFLVPDVEGLDPLGLGQPLTIHAMDAASRRPLATHPKGYFYYRQIKEMPPCRSSLFVRLHRNGTVWDIKLEQEEKAK